MNPCPCGQLGAADRACSCPPGVPERYLRRVSGPLRDRIDLWVAVDRVPPAALVGGDPPEGSRPVGVRIAAARCRQRARAGDLPNGRLRARARARAGSTGRRPHGPSSSPSARGCPAAAPAAAASPARSRTSRRRPRPGAPPRRGGRFRAPVDRMAPGGRADAGRRASGRLAGCGGIGRRSRARTAVPTTAPARTWPTTRSGVVVWTPSRGARDLRAARGRLRQRRAVLRCRQPRGSPRWSRPRSARTARPPSCRPASRARSPTPPALPRRPSGRCAGPASA
jgi:hypothetical protein